MMILSRDWNLHAPPYVNILCSYKWGKTNYGFCPCFVFLLEKKRWVLWETRSGTSFALGGESTRIALDPIELLGLGFGRPQALIGQYMLVERELMTALASRNHLFTIEEAQEKAPKLTGWCMNFASLPVLTNPPISPMLRTIKKL